jgi:hypothetical protein
MLKELSDKGDGSENGDEDVLSLDDIEVPLEVKGIIRIVIESF